MTVHNGSTGARQSEIKIKKAEADTNNSESEIGNDDDVMVMKERTDEGGQRTENRDKGI